AHPTLCRGVSAATRAVAAATVPLVAPCARRRMTSCSGVCARKISPTVIPPPSIERMSIGLRPKRSPRMPQTGLAIAIARPEALAETAVQRSRSRPWLTPRSCEMKIDRNGNAKLNPKMAVNSANHRAARLRRQSTSPARVLLSAVQELDDPVRRHRQVVDDRLRPALAKRVLDGVGDRSGHRNGAALPGALEVLRIRVGACLDLDVLRRVSDLFIVVTWF